MDAHEAAVNEALPELSAYQFNIVQAAYGGLERAWAAQQRVDNNGNDGRRGPSGGGGSQSSPDSG